MDSRDNQPERAAELRRQAEEIAREKAAQQPGDIKALSPEETTRTLHELQVHQIELEMQNEELRRSRAEVEAGLERYTDLYDFSPVGYMTLGRDGTIRQVNLTGASLLGVVRARLTHQPLVRFIALEDRPALAALLQRVFSGHAKESCEVAIIKEGSPPLYARIDATVCEDGQECRAVVADITQSRQTEQALRDAKEAADWANRAKDDFLARLSHELRTPLTPVVAAAGMLERDHRLPADIRQDMAMISRNVALETRLIDDLLDLTRITHHKVHLDLEPVDVDTALLQTVAICQADLEANGLRLTLDLAQTHGVQTRGVPYPCIVMGDATRLQQVFWNLIKNAIKFTPDGGDIFIRSTLIAGAGDEGSTGQMVLVEVRDTGRGIEPQSLPRLFKAFEQEDPEIYKHHGGLGLGLSICKSLVEMHGGSITACSQGRGKGATFTVKLPLASVQTQCVQLPAGNAPPSGATANVPLATPLRILLVEDHADTASIMSRLLQSEGYEVQTAADVASALDCVRSNRFHLLISDLGLPDGSGLDLMRQLDTMRADVRKEPMTAIALSGYGTESDVRRSREAGFVEHLVKPISLPRLQAAIERAVGGQLAGARRDCGKP